jgi:5-methylcytosine-specific restriction endonuclease McrA
MKILVINKNGRPLMPTTPRKARVLLAEGKAKIAGRDPFTIKLNHGSSGYIQAVTLGIDAGYSIIGFSAITAKEELNGGELNLLPGVSERLTERRKYRTQRRSRLRHRVPRFDNRRRPAGWLAPSIQHKLDAHIKLVKRIKARLPITNIIIETASFDIQKINNPNIQGVEYQTGEQLGYSNLTAYIRHRDDYKCQNPNCKSKPNTSTQIHHLGYWKLKPDRSDRPANLITICVQCHTPANHQAGKFLHGWQPRVKSCKAETFMTTIYRRLLKVLDAQEAFGYETKFKREELGLNKSHHNDAFVIAGGTNQVRSESLVLEQIRCNKRSMEQFYDAKYIDTRTGEKVSGSQLFSGRRTRNLNLNGENLRVYRGEKMSKGQRRIKRQRYPYNPNDYVSFEEVVYRVIGMQNLGTGVKIADYPGVKNKVVGVAKVTSIKRRSGICLR